MSALALCASSACKSAPEQRADADREAYALVLARRAELDAPDGFSIEPDATSLRQRILRGELSAVGPASLAATLEIAAENSRDYQSRKERLYLAALDVTLERWRFALQKGGTLRAALDGSEFTAEQASGAAGFSLAQLLGSGARVLGNIGLNLSRVLTSGDGWNAVSDLGVSVTQPLLAGSGEALVKEALTQAERDLYYEARSFERFRRTFAFDVASRYFRILQQLDAVRNQENNVANLAQLTERNRALAESGRLSDIEVGQARQNELRSKNDLLNATARYERDLDDFKLFLGLPTRTRVELDPTELARLESLEAVEAEWSEDEAIELALARRLDLSTARDSVVDAERRVRVAEDALRAAWSVSAEARLASEAGKPLKFDPSDTTWSLGTTFSFPWEKLPQRNAWRAAQIAGQAAQRSFEASADQIQADLRDDLRQFETRRAGYAIQQNAVELADQRIESTRLKLDAGRADTRDLLEAQESLLEAQNAATSALIDYTLARMSIYLDMELLRVDAQGIRYETSVAPAGSAQEGGS